MQFIVTVQSAPDPKRPGAQLTLSQPVEAPDALVALERAKADLAATLEMGGLAPKSA